jgi:hypothetical protein
MIIRATQRKMMSRAVERTLPGYQTSSSRVCSGQPSVANGQSADENHVSSTSGSRSRSREPHSAHASGSLSATVKCPSGQYQTGIC